MPDVRPAGPDLGRKLGGVPVWAWTVGGGGALFLAWRWWKSRAAAPAQVQGAGSAAGAGSDPYAWLGLPQGDGSTPPAGGGSTGTAPTSSPPTGFPSFTPGLGLQTPYIGPNHDIISPLGTSGTTQPAGPAYPSGIPFTGTKSGVPVISSGQLAGDLLGTNPWTGAPVVISSAYGIPTNQGSPPPAGAQPMTLSALSHVAWPGGGTMADAILAGKFSAPNVVNDLGPGGVPTPAAGPPAGVASFAPAAAAPPAVQNWMPPTSPGNSSFRPAYAVAASGAQQYKFY